MFKNLKLKILQGTAFNAQSTVELGPSKVFYHFKLGETNLKKFHPYCYVTIKHNVTQHEENRP